MTINETIRRLMSGSLFRASSVVLQAAIAFFMMPFLIKSLGTRDYGLWALAGSLMGYYGFLDFGLSNAVGRFVSRAIGKDDTQEIRRLTSTSFYLFLFIGLCVIALSLLASLVTGYFLKDQNEARIFSAVIVIMGISIGTQFPLRLFGGVLTALARFDIMASLQVLKSIVRTAAIVYFISNGGGLLSLALISLIVELIGAAYQIFLTYKNTDFISLKKCHIDRSMLKPLYSYGWVAFVANLSDNMKLRILPPIVASFIGVEAVVFYAIAIRFIDYFQQLITQVMGVLATTFSRLDGKGDLSLIQRGFLCSASVGVMVSSFIGWSLWIYGESFIRLWVGPEFNISYDLITLMVLPITIMLAQIPARELFFGLSKQGVFAVINVIELSLILLLSVILVPMIGIKGVAVAVAVGILLPELAKPFLSARVAGISVWKVYGVITRVFLVSSTILLPFTLYVKVYSITDSFTKIVLFVTVQTIWYVILSYIFVVPKEIKTFVTNHFNIVKFISRKIPLGVKV